MVATLAATGSHARVYIVNGAQGDGIRLPELGNKKRKRKADLGIGEEVRLIQDFDFPEASNKIKTTPDGKYAVATGTYKPRMKVFDLGEHSIKFDRVTDSENVDFVMLSSDWTKSLYLQANRSLDLQTQSSCYYRVRIPKPGRALAYHFPSCDALVGGQGHELYRLNLEQGRFMQSFELTNSGAAADIVTGVNAIDINPAHQLIACGTETEGGRGTVELWDHRARERAGVLKLPYSKLVSYSSAKAPDPTDDILGISRTGLSVTALASRSNGLHLGVGTSTGHTLLYDLRATTPFTTKDQGYGLPIKKIEWAERTGLDEGYVCTADEKVLKIWDRETAANLVSINPRSPINDCHIYPNSGLVFLANEASPMVAYFIPTLGPAPAWCRFLENVTEEMEEDAVQTVYEDYKFLDRTELANLNLSHLVGTPVLKPYMHGFFVDMRLYTKARAIANPFAYAEHREKNIQERLQKEQESRIRASKAAGQARKAELAKVAVNKNLVERILAREDKESEKRSKRTAVQEDGVEPDAEVEATLQLPPSTSILEDDRFKELFTNPEYEVDETSRDFALLNPSMAARAKQRGRVPEEEEDESDSSIDIMDHADESDDASREPSSRGSRPSQKFARPSPPTSKPRLMMVDGTTSTGVSVSSGRSLAAKKASLASGQSGHKLLNVDADQDKFGNMETTFIPTSSSKPADKRKDSSKGAKKQMGFGLEQGVKISTDGPQLDEEARQGRQTKRRNIRASASKNTLRQL